MKNLLLVFLFSVSLLAQNPKVYSALGDDIYDNAPHIYKLQEISLFLKYSKKIKQYMYDVQNIKLIGTAIDNGLNIKQKFQYLKVLRKLIKTNNFFIKEVEKNFKLSIRREDNKLFSFLVNSNLLDIKKYKSTVLNYYYSHKSNVDITGNIKMLLSEDKRSFKKRAKTKSVNKIVLTDKIKRVRAKDIEDDKMMNRLLEEEIIREKAKIIQEQKKELEKN